MICTPPHPQPGSMAILLMEREVEMLNRMHHPHIIKLEEVYETPKVCSALSISCSMHLHQPSTHLQKVFLILELCRGGELSDILKKKRTFKEEVSHPSSTLHQFTFVSPQEVKGIMKMLAEAVVYMHDKG